MAKPNFNETPNPESSGFSDFTFGLPASEPVQGESSSDGSPRRVQERRPGRSSLSDVFLSLVILAAAVLGCFGMNSEMIVQRFPRVAAALHLGTPEKPAPVATGDDAHIRVWADRKTALYYCPGSALYGRTKSGHFMSQAEAQSANFEPAARRACTVAAGVAASPARLARR
jgi:hypothetical protein